MTVTGIDPVAGLTDQRLGEISMQNQMRNAASRVIVVADSSKFGRASLVRICPISAVEAIVTDGGVDPEQAAAVEKLRHAADPGVSGCAFLPDLGRKRPF